MAGSQTALMQQLHDEHAAALWRLLPASDRSRPRPRGGRRPGDAPACLAALLRARRGAGLGARLAVHRRPQHRHRRVAHPARARGVSPSRTSRGRSTTSTTPTSCCCPGWSPRRSPGCRPSTGRCCWSATTVVVPWPRPPAYLGMPEGTVKSRTHYALRALRLALEEMGVAHELRLRTPRRLLRPRCAVPVGATGVRGAPRRAATRASRSVRELAGLPGLLARIDPAVLESPPADEPLPARVLPSLMGEVRRSRRRRTFATADSPLPPRSW